MEYYKDTYIAHQAILGLEKNPKPQFEGQKPETLRTPRTHRHLRQLPAPTWSHGRNTAALLLCEVSVAWCAWRTATASSILRQRAQGGEEVEWLQRRSALHKERSIPAPNLVSAQTHFQDVKDFNNINYKIQVCCFCRKLISPKPLLSLP